MRGLSISAGSVSPYPVIMLNDRPHLLLVEDDDRIRQELLDGLGNGGFEVDVATTLRSAEDLLDGAYDLMLLDLGLPDGDGLDLCQALRERGRSLPVLILTARDAPEQRVRGLDVGADDYVVKPFHLPELIARVRTILRRAGRAPGPGRISNGALWLDPETRRTGRGEDEVRLKPREFDLLRFLMRNPGRTWTRDQLLDQVWGKGYQGDARTVDLHIRRLRTKVEEDASDPHLIETVWGVGYRMTEPRDG